jgi:hypothetical protein
MYKKALESTYAKFSQGHFLISLYFPACNIHYLLINQYLLTPEKDTSRTVSSGTLTWDFFKTGFPNKPIKAFEEHLQINLGFKFPALQGLWSFWTFSQCGQFCFAYSANTLTIVTICSNMYLNCSHGERAQFHSEYWARVHSCFAHRWARQRKFN